MGNNLFCYQTGERSTCFPQLLLKYQIGNCEVLLTAGPVENEDVECQVVPTDSGYTNIKKDNRPTFIPQNGQCIFVAACQKQKNQILAVVQEADSDSKDKTEADDKQSIFEVVQGALKMADSRQMKSIGFPVFESKDYTTSATIMLMAIKLSLTEQNYKCLKRIAITLDHIEQVSNFKWVFQQVFKLNQSRAHVRTYSSSITQGESLSEEINQTNDESKENSP